MDKEELYEKVYESVMTEVSDIVRQELNELSVGTVKRAYDKRIASGKPLSDKQEALYKNYCNLYQFELDEPLTKFDHCDFRIYFDSDNDRYGVEMYFPQIVSEEYDEFGFVVIGHISEGESIISVDEILISGFEHEKEQEDSFREELEKCGYKFFSEKDAYDICADILENSGIALSTDNFVMMDEVPELLKSKS